MVLPRRWVRWVSGVFALILVGWLILCFLVVQHPTENRLTHSDAVVVLGPPNGDRISTALDILAQGLTTNVVVSLPAPVFGGANHLCEGPPPGVTVTCFVPSPGTTQGEAEEVGRLARQHGWTSVIVVTSKYHVSRARVIFDRCLSGRVEVVSTHETISAAQWAYQYLYQTAGYLKALIHSSC